MRIKQRFLNYLAIPFIFAAFLIFICGIQVSQAGVCDVDADCNIDINDINLINAALNKPASGPDDPRDADRDGKITVLDARKCVLQCTKSRCAIVAPSCAVQEDIDKDGFTVAQGDCDDHNSAVYPGAAEVCNRVDDNCNGQVDEGVTLTFYADADSDGFGNPAVSVQACTPPAGYVANNKDCNDGNPAIYPGAAEIANNGIDEDCNGEDLVVLVPHPPEVLVAPLAYIANEGEVLEVNVTGTDPDGTPVTISASPSIPNASFSLIHTPQARGTFTFRPDFTQQGIYNVTFTARDPLGYTDKKTIRITVNDVNHAPVLSVASDASVDEGKILRLPVEVSDQDGDILTVTASGLPENAVFIEAARTLTFSPNFDQEGVYNVNFEANDGKANSGQKTVHITVNDMPSRGGELNLNVSPVESPTFLKSSRITGAVNANAPPSPAGSSALITGMDTTTGMQGATLKVTLTGDSQNYATHFAQGSSKANFSAGITVKSTTVKNLNLAEVSISITPDAAEGPRSVSVTTGDETAVSVVAFNVTKGKVKVTGVLTDSETGQPLAGAMITIQGTNITVITNAEGLFTLSDVPAGKQTLIVNAPNHDLISLPVDARIGTVVDIGNVKPQSIVFDPSAPPSASVFSIAGRGAGDVILNNVSEEDAEKLVIDTIIAVGGTEAGVLDEFGNQLNPNVEGSGLVSLKKQGVTDVAEGLITGDTHSLGEILALFLRTFDYNGEPVPGLIRVLEGIQREIDSSWASPGDGSPLIITLFNQKRSLLGDPPRVNLDTTLNSLQTYLLVTSLMTFVHNQVAPVTQPSGMLKDNMLAFADSAFTNFSYDTPVMLLAQNVPGTSGPANKGFSVIWEDVFAFAEPKLINGLKNKGIKICKDLTTVAPPSTCGNGQVDPPEDCDGTPGCASNCQFAIKPSPPGCKETAELASLLISNMADKATDASGKFTQFFMSEAATNETAERIRQEFKSESFQTAWSEAKKEARSLGKLQKLLDMGKDFVMGSLNNMAGAIVGSILDIQANMIIESLRPDPPLITKVEQLPDPSTGKLSSTVRITFQRSLKDPADTGGNQTWFYELWRDQGGQTGLVTSGRVRTPEQGPGPRPTDNIRTLIFYDTDAPEGSAMYRIRSIRLIGQIVTSEPPNVMDTIYQMASGLVPLNFATPGGMTLMGGDTLKMLLDPAAKILEGIKIQKSLLSDAEPVFVTLKDRPASPPANIAVDSFKGTVYMSIPALSRIFQFSDGAMSDFTNAGFKTPYQTGLAIDRKGYLYTDNSASDMQFGGRVFRFNGKDGSRSFVGSVNYYSLLIQYARPVMVQSMVIGPSQFGEALYIADSLNNRITQLRLPESLPQGADLSHNVSQIYAQSDNFIFGAGTAMAFRGDGTMFVTNSTNLLSIPPGGGRVEALFNDTNALSPFKQLSGVAADRMGNLYVSDSQLNTIIMIPSDGQIPNLGLAGYDNIDKKKLYLIRGINRPTQVQLAPNARGLVYFDAGGLHSIGFGMSGRVTDISGNSLIGVKVSTSDQEMNRLSVTDTDGVFVLPDLVTGTSNVVEINIRYDNKTQTERVVLDPLKHNIVDFVFNPPAPPTGNGQVNITKPSVSPSPAAIDVRSGDTVVLNSEVSIPKVNPAQPPQQGDIETRVRMLSPGDDSVTVDPVKTIRGFVTDPSVTAGTLIVNGVEQAIGFVNGEFEVPAQLQEGGNDIVVRVVEGGVKGEFIKGAELAATDTRGQIDSIGVSLGETLAASFRGGAIGSSVSSLLEKLVEAAPARTEIQNGNEAVKIAAVDVLTLLEQGRIPAQGAVDSLNNVTADLAAKTNTLFGAGAKGQEGTGGMIKGLLGAQAARSSEINIMVQGIGQKMVAATDGIAARAIDLTQALLNFHATAPAGLARDQVEQAANSFLGTLQPVQGALGARGLPSDTQLQENAQKLQGMLNTMTLVEGSFDNATKSIMQNIGAGGQAITTFIGTSTNDAAVDIGRTAAKTSTLAGKALDVLFSDIARAQIILTAEFTAKVGEARSLSDTLSSQLAAGQLPAGDAFDTLKERAQAVETSARTSWGSIGKMVGDIIIGAAATQSEIGLQASLAAGSAAARMELGLGKIGEFMGNINQLNSNVENLPKGQVPPLFKFLSGDFKSKIQGMMDSISQKTLPLEIADRMGSDLKGLKELFTVNSSTLKISKAASSEEAKGIMEKAGFDVTIAGRVKDTESRLPVAGLKIGVPGTDFETSTDADGVYKLNLQINKLDSCVQLITNLLTTYSDSMKSIVRNIRSSNDRDLSRMYAQLGGGSIGNLFNDRNFSAFIQAAVTAQEKSQNCISEGDAIKDISRRLEELGTGVYSELEAGREPTPEQETEINQKLTELTGKLQDMTDSLSSMMKAMNETNMAVIRNIK